MQRHDVASMLSRRCINVMCPLGGIHGGGQSRPVKNSNIVSSEMIAGQSICMRARIVLLQCTRPMPSQKWNSLGVQYFIIITLRFENPRNDNQARKASPSISVPLMHTDIGMPLPISTVNSLPSIGMAKVEA